MLVRKVVIERERNGGAAGKETVYITHQQGCCQYAISGIIMISVVETLEVGVAPSVWIVVIRFLISC